MEALVQLATGLQQSDFGGWARGSAWAYPAANLIHLLGLVLILGGTALLDLRIIGIFRALPVAALSRAVLPLALAGLALMMASGAVLFAADAESLARSPLLRWKLMLILIALINALAFRLLWNRAASAWDTVPAPQAARAMALASLMLWLGIASAGRLIAYS
ncbi:hypothetical protein [Sphingomonas sp. LaA6.9]|uniref:hypothetical protein n=1 Tax=Sphingomonas sp. LaA6.9 TaxID=2919914 RepID=UPI001F4F6E0E|nr:hypothetical protein [Sphingomonas sp. LaA6.9]MCJ8158188.1 hypothetical protein [Sphingomonas sp. LaA6.9]